ncbi:hypothetical protein HAX54_004082 [Datura stramonium]|uniref:Uncharacterized protein n=1 Tax=Datura stramonium TaxID=4076 RepID=A0ABS8T6E7_DATST|nr:hypothetical protein [Datura stramonium]
MGSVDRCLLADESKLTGAIGQPPAIKRRVAGFDPRTADVTRDQISGLEPPLDHTGIPSVFHRTELANIHCFATGDSPTIRDSGRRYIGGSPIWHP